MGPPDRMPILQHLRTLGAVARSGGVRSSSEPLMRAASAVSRSIGLLEASLGAPLFERKAQGMLPTRAGELAHARYLRIEAELRAVLDEASALRASEGSGAGGRSGASTAGGASGASAAAIDALFDEQRLAAVSLLAELRHMPSAGRRLGVSQPAVSAALARVEGALGVRLFQRTARGLVPTDAGARWTVRVERALAELRHLRADVAAERGSLEGTVTVGSLPLARARLLPLAVCAVQAGHPGLRVHSLESPYEQLCAGLLSGRVDFIVGALRPRLDKALAVEPLFTDELGLIAAASHPLAARGRLRLADLRSFPWVLSRPGTPLREALDGFFAARGEPPPVPAVETGDQVLVRGLLLQGRMLTVLSTRQLRHEIEAGQLALLRLPMPGLRREIGLTTRSGAMLSAAALALMERIRRAVDAA